MKENCESWQARIVKDAYRRTVKLLKDIYARITNHWRSSFVALMIFVGLAGWAADKITMEQLIAYFGGVATVTALFYRGGNQD